MEDMHLFKKGDMEHPNKEKYPNQTIIPSRKMNKKYNKKDVK
jgi:hypothetical protein